jgi:hypothetical protein
VALYLLFRWPLPSLVSSSSHSYLPSFLLPFLCSFCYSLDPLLFLPSPSCYSFPLPLAPPPPPPVNSLPSSFFLCYPAFLLPTLCIFLPSNVLPSIVLRLLAPLSPRFLLLSRPLLVPSVLAHFPMLVPSPASLSSLPEEPKPDEFTETPHPPPPPSHSGICALTPLPPPGE